ncbi:hypothetical protein [Novosphingobium sp.]|uniref:hypothetical protein n=1 Tax=Novosphingobium sp. TaxID=1874826 RepID=UPI003D13CDCE
MLHLFLQHARKGKRFVSAHVPGWSCRQGLISVFAVLGEISYPLYAVNQPLARWLNYFAGRYATINPQVYIVVALALVTAIAFGISRLYDIPVRAMLQRKLASPRMAQTNGL